ncbi:type I restriction endonuclease subunit R [Crocosphaera sp.]|uniref:type I restriction endonuclease subunit R n=1 Tax=Crocosphaera sp. TaxID=2729996 RepID=UPI003F280F49|nr:DEAD/DEAH box helicase family protein [Crocosphaera sp.]
MCGASQKKEPSNDKQLTLQQLQELEKKLSQADELRRIAQEQEKRTKEELEAYKAQIAAIKAQNEAVPDSHNYNETQTRRYIVDVLLAEAGWDVDRPNVQEYPVTGMPTKSGKGKVDYVLWGDNGNPLAVVETKRTRKNPENGQQQAKLYADCLEKEFGQRPVIFYSNGYQTYLWDDRNYPPREVYGFLKKDELERLIFRRSNRKKLYKLDPKEEIVNRSYQKEAIRSVSEQFEEKRRKALLVMATGTGKTRTAIALIELLQRANWVNRVLFLADRGALVTQAFRAFKTHLPQANIVDLTKTKTAQATIAKIVVSTYPTMFNRIDEIGETERLFGVGHFDLIIVDEAHRSIYQKYQAIFDYFDGLLIGLTATPRAEVHRDTYRVFELDSGVPTFAYELNDAVFDGYLIPPKGINIAFKFLRTGVKYHELSEEEQEEYEVKFYDEENEILPEQIDATALNRWLFNENTVDQALEILMEFGLKIEGGDRLGKTIIFARNHDHAEFIVKRFNINYPHYQGHFARVIDSHDPYAQSTLDEFSDAQKQPTIAVSVDMLDTGVDVPEILNLVFFKPIFSPVKFNQMIGRGTRLCPDLFGIKEDKTEFLIFDLCGNFEYFEEEIKEKQKKPRESLSSRLFKARLTLSQQLNKQQSDENENLKNSILDNLHQHTASMEKNNFLIRRQLKLVEEYSDRNRWNRLKSQDVAIIKNSLASLPNGLPTEKRLSKEFDLLCIQLQLSILKKSSNLISLRDKVRDILDGLEAKAQIPLIKAKSTLIQEAQAESWWIDVTPTMVETLRRNLRDLVDLIDPQQKQQVYSNFQDNLDDIEDRDVPTYQTGFSPHQYKKKVRTYILANENHIAIAKLKRNHPLTESDLQSLEDMLYNSPEIESKEQFMEFYKKEYGKKINLKRFIRNLVGLDRAAAKQAFSQYLQGKQLSSKQIRFIEEIIDHLTKNGILEMEQLYQSPFTDYHYEGIDGIFNESEADEIVALIESFNQTIEDSSEVA